MKLPSTTLIFMISGFAFSILSILVDSKTPNGANSSAPPPQPHPQPSPRPPLSPLTSSPPLPSPQSPRLSPRPRIFVPPPPTLSLPHPNVTRHGSPPLSTPRNNINNNQGWKRSGKKVGLSFVGIAALLQICVVGFLVFKRRQLQRYKERYAGLS